MAIVTLDPTYNTANITLSNGNLTLTDRVSSAWYPARATTSFGAGKIYFEVTCNTSNGGATQVGVVNAGTASNNYIGSDNYSIGYQASGNIANIANTLGNIGSWTTGDTLCVAFDCATQKVWFRKNGGNWNNTTDNPATNTGGWLVGGVFNTAVYPAASAYFSGDQLTANFGATAFAQAVPAGFTAAGGSGAAVTTQARAMVLA